MRDVNLVYPTGWSRLAHVLAPPVLMETSGATLMPLLRCEFSGACGCALARWSATASWARQIATCVPKRCDISRRSPPTSSYEFAATLRYGIYRKGHRRGAPRRRGTWITRTKARSRTTSGPHHELRGAWLPHPASCGGGEPELLIDHRGGEEQHEGHRRRRSL